MLPKLLRTTLIVIGLITVLIVGLVGILLYNNRPPHMTVPTPKMPKPNGWDDFVLAGKMVRKSHRKFGPYSDPNREPEQWTKAELKSYVDDVEPILSVVRRGFTKPYLSPPIRNMRTDREIFSNWASMRELGRTFCGEARYYTVIGRPEKAANSLLDCIEMGVTLPRGGCFLAGLVGRSIESTATTVLPAIIPKLTPKDLSKVAARLDRIQRKRVPFSDIVLEDGRTDIAAKVEIYNMPGFNQVTSNPIHWFGKGKSAEDVWTSVRYSFINKKADLRDYDRYSKALAKEQRAPYTGKSSVPRPRFSTWDDQYFDMKLRRQIFVSAETVCTLIQTEVALRRYHADQGVYPNKLSQLAPKYLKTVPADPFGGKPLKYQSEKNGKAFLLYSISGDMKDDGGKPAPWEHIGWYGDLVAGKPKVKP